jgi:hypothetical protein
MGKFYITKTWLEDREIAILETYNFKEEIWETEIPEDKRWILNSLEAKGFIYSVVFKDKKYYVESVGYSQHFDNTYKNL